MHKDNIDGKVPTISPYETRTITYGTASTADYDVYPYATFTVPSQLQTFNQRDCNDGNMACDNSHSLQRKRKNSSKNSTDTLSLGNSMIQRNPRLAFFYSVTSFFPQKLLAFPINKHCQSVEKLHLVLWPLHLTILIV